MTIIRTARPRTSMDSGFATGIDALRVSLDAAERAIGSSTPFIDTGRTGHWSRLEIALSMIDHPQEWRMLELTLSTNRSSNAFVDRWGDTDPSAEAIALTRAAMEDAVAEWEPADDEIDEVVVGLAWTMMTDHAADTVLIERGTPWSAARILTGLHITGLSPGTPVQFDWTPRDPRSENERAALQTMRLGTVIEPHGQNARLRPLTRMIRADDAVEPMVRLRALAAWAEFRDARR